jgi:hypothetical protein
MTLTPDQQKIIDHINTLSRKDMAYLWRFSPASHPYFRSKLPYFKVFVKRFMELGGWSPELSKEIGW